MAGHQGLPSDTSSPPAPDEPSVFISYRRADAAGSAGRLHGDLKREIGAGRVFRDRDMRPGTNWVKRLQTVAGACHVMLVVVGPRWATVTQGSDPTPRLAKPDDTLRVEVETALSRDEVTIIPVTVDEAQMPDPSEVPPSLAELCQIQAFSMSDAHWDYDLARLVAELERVLGLKDTTVLTPKPKPKPETEPGGGSSVRATAGPSPYWVALAGPVAALVLAAPVSALLANRPQTHSAAAIGDLAEARRRIVYFGLERGLFWAIVGACLLAAWTLIVMSDRAVVRSALAGFGAGAIGGLLGGLVFFGLLYLTNPGVDVIPHGFHPALVRLPSVLLPGAFLGWALAGRSAGVSRLDGLAAGLVCGLIAGAVEWPVFEIWKAGHGRWIKVVIDAAVITGLLVVFALARTEARTAPRPAIATP